MRRDIANCWPTFWKTRFSREKRKFSGIAENADTFISAQNPSKTARHAATRKHILRLKLKIINL